MALRWIALVSIVGAWLLFPAVSSGSITDGGAKDGTYSRKLSAESGIGAAFPSEEGLGTGLSYGLSVSKRFSKRLGLEILLERDSLSIGEGFAGLEAGNLGFTSFLFSYYLFFSSKGRLVPYALLGAGFYFYDYAPNAERPTPEKEVVDRFALHFGGGVDYMISDRLALTAKARYNLVKTWVQDLPLAVPINEINPNDQDIIHFYTLVLSVGLKYYF